jgi:hypothetical protein
MRGVNTPLPTIGDVIHMTIACGRLTNPAIRCVGIAINTGSAPTKASTTAPALPAWSAALRRGQHQARQDRRPDWKPC